MPVVNIPKRAASVLIAHFENAAQKFEAGSKNADDMAANRAMCLRTSAMATGFALQIRETSSVELSPEGLGYFVASITEERCAMLDAMDDRRWRDVEALAKVMRRVDRLTA